MEYRKPEIVRLAEAIATIQGMGNGQGSLDIAEPTNQFPSVAAYEADE